MIALLVESLFASTKETADSLGQISESTSLVLGSLLIDIGIADLIAHEIEQVWSCGHRHEPWHQIHSLELLVDAELFEIVADVAVDCYRLRLL